MCNSNTINNMVHVINKEDLFVNLHLHTNYSLLDGLSHVKDVVKKVATIKQKAFAITEHGNVFSSVKAFKLAKEYELKHIYGMEAYVTENRFEKDKDKKYYHLTLLAMNEKGRVNLNKLSSLGYLEGFYYKARIDHELLETYNEGIIVLSGCMASELQRALTGGRFDDDFTIDEHNISEAKKIALWYKSVFGNRYYLEVQAHRDKRQQLLNRHIIDIAKELDIKYVATTDSHYSEEEDKELHGIFIEIGTNREAGEIYDDCFIMTSKEVYDRLTSLTGEEREQAIKESMLISDRCNVELPLSTAIIPNTKLPESFDSELAFMKDFINKGWKKRGIHKKSPEDRKIYKERLMYEMNAIEKMGFEGYFLFVESYANSVRRRGIARGSGGGSLVAYLMYITNIDPIPYGLYFERFIDVSALDQLEDGSITRKELKLPDFDLDFAKSERHLVEKVIVGNYSVDRYASLGQFGLIWDKSAIKDVGKVLNIPYAETDAMSKQLGDLTIEFAREAGLMKEWFAKYPKLFEYAEKLAGTPKSFGIHPCARCAFNKDIQWHMPVTVNDGKIVVQGDMYDAEDLGATKTDILGLKSLDVIYDTIDMVDEIDDEFINPDTLDFEDENVLKLFKEGNTSGVFQFESLGMRDTLKKMQPTGIADLGVANALFRPSSIKFIDHYAKRKSGEEAIEYLHPDLEEILGETYGIWVFQEQMISLAKLSGMRSPDTIRKAIGKKNFALMEKSKDELFDGLRARGWNEEQLAVLWQDMIDYSSYSFNKSHSSSYAVIAYQMAKLKVYYPLEFMIATLNSVITKREEIAIYIDECKKMGVTILPPDINKSKEKFTKEGNAIRFGLQAIKSVGLPTVEIINKVKSTLRMLTDDEQQEFTSFKDFYETMQAMIFESQRIDEHGETVFDESGIPKDAMVALIKSGAFGSKRNQILSEFGEVLYEPLKYKDRKSAPSKKDFVTLGVEISEKDFKNKEKRTEIFNYHKFEKHQKKEEARKQKHLDEHNSKYISNEKFYDFDTMACYLQLSPFDSYLNRLTDFASYEDGEGKIVIMGTILDKTVKKASRGGQYAKLSLVTPHGVYFGSCYSSHYLEYKDIIDKGESVVALVKKKGEEFIISKLMTFKEWKDNLERKAEAKRKRAEFLERKKANEKV